MSVPILGTVLKLNHLNQSSDTGYRIQVKVIKSWIEAFPNGQDQRVLILADENGQRITATIFNKLLEKFKDVRECEWFEFENYLVVPKEANIRYWNDHSFQIYFKAETVVNSASPRTNKEMTFFQPIPVIKDNFFSGKTSMGGIVKVENMVIVNMFPEGKYMKESQRQLKFTVADWNGKRVDCYAFGVLATQFQELWVHSNRRKVIFCVLKYWDIKPLRGPSGTEICLCAEKTYSEIHFNPSYEIIYIFREMLNYSEAFDIPIEDAYEDYVDVTDGDVYLSDGDGDGEVRASPMEDSDSEELTSPDVEVRASVGDS